MSDEDETKTRSVRELQRLIHEQQLLIAESATRAQLHVEERERLCAERARLEVQYLEQSLKPLRTIGGTS